MTSPSPGADPGLYLDANATEPLRPEAREAVLAAFELVGNPASVHADGRAARKLLEAARASLAVRLGARPENVVFCAGATEANAMAVHGLAAGGGIVIGATEHDAVRAAAPNAVIAPVDTAGRLDHAAFAACLAAHRPTLACVMAANNETGVLNDIATIAALCAAQGTRLHVDAVQAAGRVPNPDYLAQGASSVAVSAHKLGGPKGAGALLLAADAASRLVPLIRGGGQEQGRRGGTHNLPGIAGFAAALDAAHSTICPDPRLAALRDAIDAGARGCGAVIAGAEAPRLANTTCLVLPGLAAETQIIALDLAGIRVSAGAACSSGKVARSHVLAAMGLGDLAASAIRVSLPWNAPEDAPARFLAAYRRLADRALRKSAHVSTSAA